MLKQIKKLTALLFVAATMFTFASCNKDDENTPNTNTTDNPAAVADTEWRWEAEDPNSVPGVISIRVEFNGPRLADLTYTDMSTGIMQSDVLMETGEISKKLGRGKHTTRHSQLIAIDEVGSSFIVDTPGFSTMDIPGFEKEDLNRCYPEFYELSDKCRFAGCAHINEPDCEVKAALEEGRISEVRYNNYVKLYEELASKSKY